jgi:redox-sensitive bicupin YhaK (pirin superfamily)
MKNPIETRHALTMKEGDGADVKRLMPVQGFMNFDPFVLWDHFDVKPGAGFPDHPHRGFEAITYIFSGSMKHKDNLGNESTVTSGGAQRFTAGKGLIHSEMPSPEGNTEGIQLWINLPQSLKTIAPDYQQVDAQDFPEQIIEKGKIRVIVGEGSPLKLKTSVRYLDVNLESGGQLRENVSDEFRGVVYVVAGNIILNGNTVGAGNASFIDGFEEILVTANEPSRFMVCFGKPHGEPIRQNGPFVD